MGGCFPYVYNIAQSVKEFKIFCFSILVRNYYSCLRKSSQGVCEADTICPFTVFCRGGNNPILIQEVDRRILLSTS